MVASAERRALTVGAVFREASVGVIADFRAGSMEVKAWRDLRACRTADAGGHLLRCRACGHEHPVYNSCRNRHCPTCQPYAQSKWIEARMSRVLPIHHFHLVFTLPAELRPLARAHPRRVYDLLFAAASTTLSRMAKDALGGTLGVTLVLHTWVNPRSPPGGAHAPDV